MPKASKFKSRAKAKTFTPTGIRRFFFKLELLGKRRGEQVHDFGTLDPVVDTPTGKAEHHIHSYEKENFDSAPSTRGPPDHITNTNWPMRVALQNEDAAEDAVVITALDNIPFCCHEDLVTMPRDKLISVALALNAKLPAAMAIDVSHVRPNTFIRSAIELIVGLRGDVPQAPKAVRSRPENDPRLFGAFDMQSEMNKSPPTSPLAQRGGGYHLHTSLGSPQLERLEEEEEEGAERQQKKRKLSLVGCARTDSDVDMEPETTPTPLPRMRRTQSHGMAPDVSPTRRVLRSQSQKLEKAETIDTTFIKNKRPAYRYQSKVKRAEAEAESGEGKPLLDVQTTSGVLRPIARYRPFVLPADKGYTSRSRSNTRAFSSSSRMSVEESPKSSASMVGMKRKRSVGQSDAENQMTTRVGEMNMGTSTSDMDVGA